MRVAIVVHRYGEDIIGGAESHARQIAEKLASELSWDVDVITTTARDYQTWHNHFPEGWSVVNGINVCRFNSTLRRSRLFPYVNRRLASLALRFGRIKVLTPLASIMEIAWLVLQGPVNMKIARYLRINLDNYDRFIFFTYLYFPTIWGIHTTGDKSVLIPTAHDEQPFHFLTVRKMFQSTPHILANSIPEQELIVSLGIPPSKVSIAGLGIDGIESYGREEFPGKHPPGKIGQSEASYVLYLGRISKGKNVDLLMEFFEEFHKQTDFKDINLLLAGHREDNIDLPERPGIRYLGYLSDDEKTAYIAGAACLINPSAMESMSMIVLEAMALGRPVLVNRQSPALRYYTERTRTVFGYDDEQGFIDMLSSILVADWRDASHTKALEDTRHWVIDNYSWEKILNGFNEVLTGGAIN